MDNLIWLKWIASLYWRLMATKSDEIKSLLRISKSRLSQLKLLLENASNHWDYEDLIYRFYHHSYKTYRIQEQTQRIVEALQGLAPHLELNSNFIKIISQGTNLNFEISHNKDWLFYTRPMLEAFFHAKHMLEMICKYGEELDEPPQILPSGWATILYLYNLR